VLRVSENKLPRIMLGPKREEVTGGWRKPHDELSNLCSVSKIVGMITSRWMR